MIQHNFYKILGCHAGMDNDEIKQAWRALARKHHPDVGGDKDKFAELALAFAAVRDAAMRQQVANRWKLMHERCAVCGGDGFTTSSLGFTLFVKKVCSWCDGAGFV